MLRCPSGSTRLITVPVGDPGTTRPPGRTPAAASSATSTAPAASSPTHPARTTGTPSCVRWTATLAPAPPPRLRIDAGRSDPGAGSPHRTATTSVATSPTTTTGRTTRSAFAGRERGGDPAGELGVAQHQADVDRERGALAGPVQVVEHEGGDRLAAHPGGLGCAERVGDHTVVQLRVELLVGRERLGDHHRARGEPAAGGENGG